MTEQQDQTRARFIAAIGVQVNPAAIAEVHLFQPIRQGPIESGVAVVAVQEALGSRLSALGGDAEHQHSEAEGRGHPPASGHPAESRLAIYTATYRLTLKGPERGKWEFAMNAEADAPLVTVDVVVRGVQRRSGDAEDPAKLSGDEFRELLPPPLTPTP